MKYGVAADESYVEDVVQSAFADTYLGTLAWDPSRAPLEAHVILAIKSRTRHDREIAAKRPRRCEVSFDLHDQTRGTARIRAEVETQLASESRHESDAHAIAERALAALRAITIAEDADDVIELLDAYETGAYTKPEILEVTSLTPRRYRNARARLATFTKRLPAEAARVYA